jgi:hypothetical protein
MYVYSYGNDILLLEMFTGVSLTNEQFRDGFSLHGHVGMVYPDHVMEIVILDAKPFTGNHGVADNAYTQNNIDDCLVSVLQCALQCPKSTLQ